MVDLSNCIHTGIIKAQKDYISWSELGLGHSAEYLIVTNIAQVIASSKYINDLKYIFVEQSIKELAEWDELTDRSKLRTGRCDICIEDEDNYSIIEVKNTLTNKGKTYDSILHDIERIEIFLKNNNYLKESYICFMNANYIKDRKNSEENKTEILQMMSTKLEVFSIDVHSIFPKLLFSFTHKEFIETTAEDKIWGWSSVVAKIKLS